MGKRMYRDLVPRIQTAHFLRLHLIVLCCCSAAGHFALQAEQSGIEVESGLQAVTAEQLDKPAVLRHAVVVAEGDGFVFSLKHIRYRLYMNFTKSIPR